MELPAEQLQHTIDLTFHDSITYNRFVFDAAIR